MCVCQSKMVNMRLQSFLIRVVNDPQSHLTTFTSDRSDHRWAIILICTVSALFVGAAPRWIVRIKVFFSFFPQHSETFRRFQYADRGSGVSG